MCTPRGILVLAACLVWGMTLAGRGSAAVKGRPVHSKPVVASPQEDPLPEGAIVRLGSSWRGLEELDGLACVAFSADGKWLATASHSIPKFMDVGAGIFGDNKGAKGRGLPRKKRGAIARPCLIHLWDATTRQGVRCFENEEVQLSGIAFSPDGKTLTSGGLVRGVALWDLATGKTIHRFAVEGGVRCIAFSPDGKTVAAGCGRVIHLWDVSTRKKLRTLTGHGNVVVSLAYGRGGQTIASASWDGTIRIWDVGRGREVRRWKGHGGWVLAVAYAPGGRLLASAGEDGVVRLWDATSGKQLRRFPGHESWVQAVAFAPGGKVLGSAGWDNTVRLWDVATGKEIRCFNTRGRDGPALAFSADGKAVASTGRGQALHLWSVATGKELVGDRKRWAGHQGGIESVAYAPDGVTVATASIDGTVRLWEMPSGKPKRRFPVGSAGVVGVVFSPNGKLLAAAGADGVLSLWDPADGKCLRRWRASATAKDAAKKEGVAKCVWQSPSPVAFSPDGKVLAAGGEGSAVCFWEVDSGRKIRTIPRKGEKDRVTGVAFSPDGELLATASKSLVIELWQVRTGKRLRPFQWQTEVNPLRPMNPPAIIVLQTPGRAFEYEYSFSSVVFSPDGRVLAGVGDLFVFWDVRNRKLLSGRWNLVVERWRGLVSTLTFSPDGRALATGSWDSGIIDVWEVATGKVARRFTGASGVWSLSFSPDGTTLVSAGADDPAALVWDVTGMLRDGRLPRVKLTVEDLTRLWGELRSDRADRAQRAIWQLVAAPAQSVPFLDRRFAPVPAEKLQQLVKDLEDRRFAVRNKAARQLERALDQATPALRRALDGGPALETRLRVERLLEKLPGERLRVHRAVAVLERLGTCEARQLLKRFAKGPREARLTQEAEAALSRLGRRASGAR